MFKLIVTNKITNQVEQSDFQTEQECLSHKAYLESIGYSFEDKVSDDGSTIPSSHEYKIEEYKLPLGSISPRQIRMALLSMGVNENAVETAIATLPSPQKEQAMIAWKYSTEFIREQASVDQIGNLAGLTSEQLDNLWMLAKSL